MPRTLLDLNFDGTRPFDASGIGSVIRTSGPALRGNGSGASIDMEASSRVKVGRTESLDGVDAFTIAMSVNPEKLGRTQTLIDSQSPPIRLKVSSTGVLTGAVHTAAGWKTVSSRTKLKRGTDTKLRFVRDKSGNLKLEINGRLAGKGKAPGALVATGRSGVSVGTDIRGKVGLAGSISDLVILDSAVTSSTLRGLRRRANKIRARIRDLYAVDAAVYIDQADVDPRFNQIKAIMHAAGVDDLSQLADLTVSQRTTVVPGTILKAPQATATPPLNWADIATEYVALSRTDLARAKSVLDATLLSRSVGPSVAINLGSGGAHGQPLGPSPAPTLGPVRRGPIAPSLSRATLLQDTALTSRITHTRHEMSIDLREISPLESVERLERDDPGEWPVMTAHTQFLTATVLPVNSAVIIARRLDLTNQILEIDPAVGTLYIIVEELEAASGAEITWKRPTLSVPNIGRDPALDGHDWSGVHTGDGSRNGLNGGDARSGAPGFPGRNGYEAPSVEIWALRVHGMPDIDLEGQRGGKGGRGQQGGEGGHGARGEPGKYYWFFGKHCWEDPGNGGDGGDGGDGGRGGRGGEGGDAGNITFAVLEESLASLTTTNAFTPNLDAGDPGNAGDGGVRGEGGPGGRRGYTEVCDGGDAGARGQPGRVGDRGPSGSLGGDGLMTIMTVTQEAWDEQLTRPWLYDVTPDAAFPGTVLALKGSRFADTDTVHVNGTTAAATLRADGGLDVTLPTTIGGGEHSIYSRRHDGQESNRLPIIVKPQLTGSLPALVPGVSAVLEGRAFVAGAAVEYEGSPYPATVSSPTRLSFQVPETTGMVSSEQNVILAVTNPDGQRSNELTGTIPRVVKNGFQIGVHDFNFNNDADGRPSWGTFEDTYGAVEVWHELLDPIFGHPILTAAFYFFYQEFLDGEDNGGLATGFCTALASMALDRFWTGHHDTFATVTRDTAFREEMTAIHGRLLTRESLLDFHDQGRRGQANVVTSFQQIESIFESGGTRETAPMLFFVPDGAAWDGGYFDKLADSHCIVPTRIQYPAGYDGSNLDGVRMYCWDNNHHDNHDCYVDFRTVSGQTRFKYTAAGTEKFDSDDGITLAVATLGEYLLRDLDLPFGGPFGLTTFVLDFLLSPASLQVLDGSGRVTGRVGGQILSEIPDSHPCYLIPGAYLLPTDTGLTRRITGTDAGSYSYGSLSPNGVSIGLTNVPTQPGETDRLLTNADGTRVRFVPAVPKSVDFTMGRRVGDVVRGVSIDSFAASPLDDLDVTSTPDLSMVRVSNRGAAGSVDVKVLGFDMPTQDRASFERSAVNVPAGHDLVVTVTDWEQLTEANVSTTVVES